MISTADWILDKPVGCAHTHTQTHTHTNTHTHKHTHTYTHTHTHQSWALAVFFNFVNNEKCYFLHIFYQVNWLVLDFLNRTVVEIRLLGIGFKEIGTFYFLKTKDTASAQLWHTHTHTHLHTHTHDLHTHTHTHTHLHTHTHIYTHTHTHTQVYRMASNAQSTVCVYSVQCCQTLLKKLKLRLNPLVPKVRK